MAQGASWLGVGVYSSPTASSPDAQNGATTLRGALFCLRAGRNRPHGPESLAGMRRVAGGASLAINLTIGRLISDGDMSDPESRHGVYPFRETFFRPRQIAAIGVCDYAFRATLSQSQDGHRPPFATQSGQRLS